MMKRKDYGVDLEAQTMGSYKPHQIGKAHQRKIIDFNRDYMNLDEFFVQVNNQLDGSGSGNLTSQDEEATQMKPNVDLLASLLSLGKMIQDQKVLIKQQQAQQEQQHKTVPVEKMDSSHVKPVTINQSITNTKEEPVQACSSVSDNDAMESHQIALSKSLGNEENVIMNVDEKHPPSSWSESESTLSIKRGLIPDTIKDVDYWDRRKRNNIAAKKSREERRKKELEVLQVTKQLESENLQLTTMLKRLNARNELLESRIQGMRERHHNASSGTVSSSAEES